MRFTKMHGAGNDFIILEDPERRYRPDTLSGLARRLCDRRRGLGADGLMVVVPPTQGGDYGMLFYNDDGSESEMCGNGARCIARYGVLRGYAGDTQRIETAAGPVIGQKVTETEYRVRLNDPSVLEERSASDGTPCGYAELGNPGIPHANLPMAGLLTADREALRLRGRALRNDPAFPRGANVTFWEKREDGSIDAVTYERGVEDFTLACGTGAGALAAVLTQRGIVSGEDVRIRMPGGLLRVEVRREAEIVRDLYLTGPTCLVAEGEISPELLADFDL